ncbi:MAG TPA: DUF2865 domain-containing protein, partial [Xanthobacteraceae bacterium]|nr:DUF2865 domain-containing protein [Xanthobacteraceae bacterium]
SQAVSLAGKRYTELSNAFHYRQEYNSACSCRRAGQSWADAMGQRDTTVERGDIVVTDQKSKAMAQPPAKPVKQDTRVTVKPGSKTAAPAEGTSTPVADPDPTSAPASAEKRPIRTIGPQLLQAR